MALAAAGCLASLAQAHVFLSFPLGGEKIPGGSVYTIAWDADDHDCVYNLYFSPDSGGNWTAVVLDLAQTVRSYKWTVPNEATAKGIIRILQDNRTGTDLDDRSQAFTIEETAGVKAPVAARGTPIAPHGSNVYVTGDGAADAGVGTRAFDARGRTLQAWWPQGR
jgi:hypothetical protein